MRLLALDLAARCGVAIAEAGQSPRSIVWPLRKKGQDAETASRNLGVYLRDLFVLEMPELIAAEDFLNPVAQPSADAAIMQLRLHGALDAVAGAYGVPVRRVPCATVRIHFCGKATAHPAQKRGSPPRSSKQKAQEREDTKRMIFKRAQTLGYIERGAAEDWDRADALALWDYSAATFCRAPRPFALFGAEAAR